MGSCSLFIHCLCIITIEPKSDVKLIQSKLSSYLLKFFSPSNKSHGLALTGLCRITSRIPWQLCLPNDKASKARQGLPWHGWMQFLKYVVGKLPRKWQNRQELCGIIGILPLLLAKFIGSLPFLLASNKAMSFPWEQAFLAILPIAMKMLPRNANTCRQVPIN